MAIERWRLILLQGVEIIKYKLYRKATKVLAPFRVLALYSLEANLDSDYLSAHMLRQAFSGNI